MDEDSFRTHSLIGILDAFQHDKIQKPVVDMLSQEKDNRFPTNRLDELKTLVYDFIDIFRSAFSLQSAANVPPLQLQLRGNAKAVVVKIRNYKESQRKSFRRLTNKLLDAGMIYSNPTA